MAAFREPRRVARQGWATETHLGELDSDIDELHLLRGNDRKDNAETTARLEAKIDRLTKLAIGVVISGLMTTMSLTANLVLKTLG